ncbi:MAG TPA: hypothetical protein VN848_07950 [Gemmatimonadales bacterium]|nr:hypothetical protein [Gemmatimonadales bacterium]
MLMRGVVGFVLTGVACTSMQRVQPDQFVPQHRPSIIQVTTSDSDVTTVVEPRIDGDTLRGTVAGLQERVAIPLKDIVVARAQAPDGMKTAVLVAGGVMVGGVVAYLLTQQATPPPVVTTPVCVDPDGC